MYNNYTLYTSTPCTKNTHHVQKRIHHVQNMYTMYKDNVHHEQERVHHVQDSVHPPLSR